MNHIFSSYQTTFKGSFYGFVIWSRCLDTSWSKIWLFALLETASRRIFYQQRDFIVPHVRHHLLGLLDWVLFFSSPCNTFFNRGKHRTCCLKDNGVGLSTADYLWDERSSSDRWAKCALWSSSSSKICLCNRGDFTSGRPRGWKPKSAIEHAGILGPKRYLYMWDCTQVPLSSTSVIILGGEEV